MKKWNKELLVAEGYEIVNAKIEAVDMTTLHHGVLTLSMSLKGDGWGCVYGGRVLGVGGTYMNYEDIKGYPLGLDSILYIMKVVGVNNFNDLKDQYIRVATKGWGDTIEIIGNVIKDEWFDYSTFFKED